MYWGIVCPLYGISLFLPTIIFQLGTCVYSLASRGTSLPLRTQRCKRSYLTVLGYTAQVAQLLTIPIYITAAILTIIVAYFSDKAAKGNINAKDTY